MDSQGASGHSDRGQEPEPTLASHRSDGSAVMAIAEGRGCQSDLSDTQSYGRMLHQVHLMDPCEVVVAAYSPTSTKTVLHDKISETWPSISVVTVGRREFSDSNGLSCIKRHTYQDDLSKIMLGLESKYFCLAAVSALFHYLESVHSVSFANGCLKFQYQLVDGMMMIDHVTAKNLELCRSLLGPRHNMTLLGVLDKTQTPMGARLLRLNLLQPLKDPSTLNMRLDAVEALVQSELIRIPKRAAAHRCEQSINTLLKLKHIFADPALEAMQSRLGQTIDDDVTYQRSPLTLQQQRCYAVKPGFSGLLDVARQTYKEAIDDVYALVNGYRDTYRMNISETFTPKLGFALAISKKKLAAGAEWPAEFIGTSTKRNTITFTTLSLKSLNERIREALAEVYLMSDSIIESLMEAARQSVGWLYQLSEALAMLDMLLSFAHYRTARRCCRPEFSDTLALQSARHPVREMEPRRPFVANDAYASPSCSVQIITGPNMSGKSTYMRQIALITIMAHVGMHVPATFASVRLTDRMFSRLGSDQSVTANASSFMMEMRECAFILEHLTIESMVFIDELGRAHLMQHLMRNRLNAPLTVLLLGLPLQAFVFFSTHFWDLANVLKLYPNVVNLRMRVSVDDKGDQGVCGSQSRSIRYLYSVESGVADQPHYGIQLAAVAGLPHDVIKSSLEISEQASVPDAAAARTTAHTASQAAADSSVQLEQDLKLRQQRHPGALEHRIRRLEEAIKRHAKLPETELRSLLKAIRLSFVEEMSGLIEDSGAAVDAPISTE
ncbi:muts domain V-domain-containing protein [Polychytrium aggregatum]|uniref:muts domain V-domain-containing protein n=1 Tax=Polychytrium aggregatum TaxID=110093 RepID=UPI0022FF3931|nr:muts domain V-domain-containing protein [Polychytrium aggregatum]KAI9203037.1 muts domain V-domain-containing protein [Polychytrium aggregatum]